MTFRERLLATLRAVEPITSLAPSPDEPSVWGPRPEAAGLALVPSP